MREYKRRGCIPDQKLERYNLQIEFQLLLDSPRICVFSMELNVRDQLKEKEVQVSDTEADKRSYAANLKCTPSLPDQWQIQQCPA